jgi:hypothetical protein
VRWCDGADGGHVGDRADERVREGRVRGGLVAGAGSCGLRQAEFRGPLIVHAARRGATRRPTDESADRDGVTARDAGCLGYRAEERVCNWPGMDSLVAGSQRMARSWRDAGTDEQQRAPSTARPPLVICELRCRFLLTRLWRLVASCGE